MINPRVWIVVAGVVGPTIASVVSLDPSPDTPPTDAPLTWAGPITAPASGSMPSSLSGSLQYPIR